MKHLHDSPEEIAKLEEQYRSVVDAVKQVLGREAFFFQGERSSKFNGAVYDSIVISFSLFPKRTLLLYADKIRAGIYDMKERWWISRNIYVEANAGRRVRRRITKVIDIINRCIDQHTIDEPRYFDEGIRQELFSRNSVCAICGNQILSIDDCEVDHILPFSARWLHYDRECAIDPSHLQSC